MRKGIALNIPVGSTDAAVEAVVLTNVREFDDASEIYVIAHVFLSHPVGFLIEAFQLIALAIQQLHN
jgi:hypothetical protein